MELKIEFKIEDVPKIIGSIISAIGAIGAVLQAISSGSTLDSWVVVIMCVVAFALFCLSIYLLYKSLSKKDASIDNKKNTTVSKSNDKNNGTQDATKIFGITCYEEIFSLDGIKKISIGDLYNIVSELISQSPGLIRIINFDLIEWHKQYLAKQSTLLNAVLEGLQSREPSPMQLIQRTSVFNGDPNNKSLQMAALRQIQIDHSLSPICINMVSELQIDEKKRFLGDKNHLVVEQAVLFCHRDDNKRQNYLLVAARQSDGSPLYYAMSPCKQADQLYQLWADIHKRHDMLSSLHDFFNKHCRRKSCDSFLAERRHNL